MGDLSNTSLVALAQDLETAGFVAASNRVRDALLGESPTTVLDDVLGQLTRLDSTLAEVFISRISDIQGLLEAGL